MHQAFPLALITNVNPKLNEKVLPTNPYNEVLADGSIPLHFFVLFLFMVILLTMAGLGVKRKDVR